jgi:hypothetical protein
LYTLDPTPVSIALSLSYVVSLSYVTFLLSSRFL